MRVGPYRPTSISTPAPLGGADDLTHLQKVFPNASLRNFGKAVLADLADLTRRPLSPVIAKRLAPWTGRDVAAALIEDLTRPDRITQDHAETCGPTALQYWTATTLPEEYVQIVTHLALDGRACLLGGQVLNADANGTEPRGSGKRSVSQRLFQGAVMQHIGPGSRREKATDYRDDGGGRDYYATYKKPLKWPVWKRIFLFVGLLYRWLTGNIVSHGSGVQAVGLARMLSQISGRAQAFMPEGSDTILGKLAKHPGSIISVNKWRADAGHFLVFKRIEHGMSPPHLIAYNPWGSAFQKKGTRYGDEMRAPAGTYVLNDRSEIAIPLTPANIAKLGIIFPRPSPAG